MKYLTHNINLWLNGKSPHPQVRQLWEYGNSTNRNFISIIIMDGTRKDFFSDDRNKVLEEADNYLKELIHA